MTGVPDTRLLEALIDRKLSEQPSLKGGAGGGTSDGMEARVAKLETGVADIRATLGRLEPAIKGIADEQKEQRSDIKALFKDTSEIRGRLSQIPSSYQLVLGGVALIIAIFSAAFALLRFALPN